MRFTRKGFNKKFSYKPVFKMLSKYKKIKVERGWQTGGGNHGKTYQGNHRFTGCIRVEMRYFFMESEMMDTGN